MPVFVRNMQAGSPGIPMSGGLRGLSQKEQGGPKLGVFQWPPFAFRAFDMFALSLLQ